MDVVELEPSGSRTLEGPEDDLPLAVRRGRRLNCQFPQCFRDMLPEPPMPLPPPNDAYPQSVTTIPSFQEASVQGHVPPSQCEEHITQMNTFNLFHVYDNDAIPVHDPEDQSSNLGDSPLHRVNMVQGFDPENPFHPYPNENLWCLGDWYWNQGMQKSGKSFTNLLNIIGSTDFQPEDMLCTNWAAIDHELDSQKAPEQQDLGEWMDDGWECRNIIISVPFSHRCENPGPKDYTILGFYWCSLISIIQEQLINPIRCSRFRFEPYSLRWQPPHRTCSIKVHGELFTSQVFIETHLKLQDSPPEADCSLPQRIVTLMFWSDMTQLTLFGEAKLWPLYMYFGNKSKYDCAQPISHLCAHVAYFQMVSIFVHSYDMNS